MTDWKKIAFHPMTIVAAGLTLGIGAVWANLSGGANMRGLAVGLQHPEASLRLAKAPDSNSMALLRQMDETFADISETASLGVVSIISEQGRGEGQGSGFILTSDGWIVTNDHVVGSAKTVKVVLNDGREFEGKVTRANDEQVDLAMVKIEGKDLPTLSLADSNTVRPGEFALAVGAPFGLENTVTVGHISALGRGSAVRDPQFGDRGYTGMIQTDAPINPGNSGGPLINIDGEVIGVNSTIFSTNMASAGIGFAIPSKVVKVVSEEIIQTGKFDRGQIGAYIDDLKPFQKKEMNISGGAVIVDAPETGAAYKAGLRKGDVITRVDGDPLHDQVDLRLGLFKHSPNDTVKLTYVRDGKVNEASVKITAPERVAANTGRQIPDALQSPFNNGGPLELDPFGDEQESPRSSGPVTIGMGVRNLDDTMRQQFGIPATAWGVVIQSVGPGTFAEKYGMQPGDLVQQINGTDVKSVEDVRKAVAGIRRGNTVSIQFKRYENGVAMSNSVSAPIE